MRGGQPTPGNIEGGLSSIEEKSLGAIVKSVIGRFRAFWNTATGLTAEKASGSKMPREENPRFSQEWPAPVHKL